MKLPDAKKLALDLMRAHGLSPAWKFAYDRAVMRFGCCNYKLKRISLSRHLTELNDASHVRDTILHEIAHALAGPRTGHGRKWKQFATSVGCKPKSCYGDEVARPPGKFVGTCPGCKRQIYRHRKPRRKTSCSKCCSSYNAAFVIAWCRRTPD
jgi:predicted SprT family Zn-dependent metalloprotease